MNNEKLVRKSVGESPPPFHITKLQYYKIIVLQKIKNKIKVN